MIADFYDTLHKVFSRRGEKEEYSGGYWQDKTRRTALDWCSQRSGTLLDVGCGEGLFLSRLLAANSSLTATGVDVDEGRLVRARSRLAEAGKSAALLPESGTKLPFHDGAFQTVVCINVFLNVEGIETVKRMLSEMVRVCVKGGRIIIEFRNSQNLFLRLKFKLAPYYDKTLHGLPLCSYEPQAIKDFLTELGCRIIREKPFGGGRPAALIMLEAEKL